MTNYIIFTKTNLNLSQTYFQNERRGRKTYKVKTREDLLQKVKELIEKGEIITEICTTLGTSVDV